MKSQQRAAFIWAADKITSFDLEILSHHVIKAKYLGLDVKVWGPDIIKTLNDPTDPKYNSVSIIRPYYDGLPTYKILRNNCFNYSQDSHLTGDYERAWIVIDDYSQDTAGSSQFRFGIDPPPTTPPDSYILPFTTPNLEGLKDWLDNPANMNVNDLCLVIRGKKSGKALCPLWDPKRVVITSMTATQQPPLDQFNMALHLDGNFNWRAAFESERSRLVNYQTPQILPP